MKTPPKNRFKYKFEKTRSYTNAFTLVELLLVIAIIGILMSFGFYSYSAVVRSGKNAQSRATIKSFGAALSAYRNDYSGRYPVPIGDINTAMSAGRDGFYHGGQIGDVVYILARMHSSSGSGVVATPKSGWDIFSINPKDQRYLREVPKAISRENGFDLASGSLYDPYGSEYLLGLDLDDNNAITLAGFGVSGAATENIIHGIVSPGEDKTLGNGDDITSWKGEL